MTETKTFTYRKTFGTYMLQDGWSAKTMDDHLSEMLSAGWEVLQSTGGGGHVNVGRTALRVAALGIPVLLFGASRAKETITITFSRSEQLDGGIMQCAKCNHVVRNGERCEKCGGVFGQDTRKDEVVPIIFLGVVIAGLVLYLISVIYDVIGYN